MRSSIGYGSLFAITLGLGCGVGELGRTTQLGEPGGNADTPPADGNPGDPPDTEDPPVGEDPPINEDPPPVGQGFGTEESRQRCAAAAPSVTSTTLRRLTSLELNNTIRDLVGIDEDVAANLAPDGKVGPFNSNQVPIGDLVSDQLMRNAENLAERANLTDLGIPQCDLGATECIEQLVRDFGTRAFRRPLLAAEVARYRDLFAIAAENGSSGARLVMRAMLQSPSFIYHVDAPPSEAVPNTTVLLDPYRVASRLSYFLWKTMPDDALFDDAESGAILDVEILGAHAERMLADDRARETISEFVLQWLHVDEKDLEKDSATFPDFNDDVASALRWEMATFADNVIRKGDGLLSTLLTADYSYLQGPLFDHYGIEEPASHDPAEPISFPAGERVGLLTQGLFLAAHAHPNQTSPVPRGLVVRTSLLCQVPQPPPPGLETTLPDISADATTRERFEAHVSNPNCSSCHKLIDGIGFGFERYDATGRYRAQENDLPVDDSGELVDTLDIDGPFQGVPELAPKLAGSLEVRECLTSQWFTYALGRGETEDDSCSMVSIYESFENGGYSVRELILAVVTSDAFRFVHVPDPNEPDFTPVEQNP